MWREDGPLMRALMLCIGVVIAIPVFAFFLLSWASWLIPK
jgi:hypothetical protein